MSIKNKLWIKLLLGLILFIIAFFAIINIVVDPYAIYNTSFFSNKPKDAVQARISKLLKAKEIKPISIVIGTSRADMGYDPDHEYFKKPSYNLSIAGSSVYEIKYYIQDMILNNNTKQILLVLDWRMFNDLLKKTPEFETYFTNYNPYKYFMNIQTLEDSFFTIRNQKMKSMYFENGLLSGVGMDIHVKNSAGHLALMNKDDKFYYSLFPTSNNSYMGTNKNSFEDFNDILRMCYDNNIKLDIVFGPSHIRQWEAFSYYHDIEKWYKWKKDVVLSVQNVALEKNQIPYRITDFSIYHNFTAEKVPTDPEIKMKYHWESSHYKKELGDIVLDRLLDISPYKDFGVELNIKNIDNHIEKLKEDRIKFIDTKAYRKEVFGENSNKGK